MAGFCIAAEPVAAENLRIATYDVDMSYSGPGMVLDGLQKGRGDGIKATVQVIGALNADILLLTGIDFDADNATVDALAALLAQSGKDYPYRLALRPNAGVPSGMDLNQDGTFGAPEDALAWGRFAGNGGMAILSRKPIQTEGLRDFTGFRWAGLPDNIMPDFIRAIAPDLPVSTGGHWIVPVELANGTTLKLLVFSATPPVFDDARDLNGRRNHDEAALWLRLLDGGLPEEPPPARPFVVMGKSNLDPSDGDGRSDALRALMRNPALHDPAPRGRAGRTDVGQHSDADLDTALFPKAGGLRVDIILPSADIQVTGSGVMWPPADDPMDAVLTTASRHRPVWVDVSLGD